MSDKVNPLTGRTDADYVADAMRMIRRIDEVMPAKPYAPTYTPRRRPLGPKPTGR